MKKAVAESMIKMSPGEFKVYIEENKISHVVLESQGQGWVDPFSAIPSFFGDFKKIRVSLRPTVLSLINQDSSVCFHGIECIQVDQNIGKIMVHCKALLPDCAIQKRTYVLTVDPGQLSPPHLKRQRGDAEQAGARVMTLAPLYQ